MFYYKNYLDSIFLFSKGFGDFPNKKASLITIRVAKNKRLNTKESTVCRTETTGHSCLLCVFHITFRFALMQNVWMSKELTNRPNAPLSAKDML